IYETFNIAPARHFQAYGMQEINTTMPRCAEGRRYHIPPWLVPLILDQEGETLLPHDGGVVEGRAAFFDLALDGRWGGVISGEKITVDFQPCVCASVSPWTRA